MSHLITAAVRINSIPDLERAVKVFGGTLEEAKDFNSYNVERCNYRISIPNCSYQIGVVKDGDHYILRYDTFSQGSKLVEKFGANLGGLSQEYTAQVCTMQMKKKFGWRMIRKKLPNGKLQLRMIHA